MAIRKIEVNFALPVELTQAEMQVIDTIANDAERRTETAELVHWAAGCGDKPNWSKTDCKIFGYEPTPDSPDTGEPTFDESVFFVETASRERYDSEPFDLRKRRTPIADLLLMMRDPDKRAGITAIREERARQLTVEGWTARHDDQHEQSQLAAAAVCYAQYAHLQLLYPDHGLHKGYYTDGDSPLWPFEKEWFKPSADPIRNLVKAGALIAAELDRLRRKAEMEGGNNGNQRTSTADDSGGEQPDSRSGL